MIDSLRGQVALITGAASEIGTAICRELVAAGATVVAADDHYPEVQALALSLGKQVIPRHLDVTDPDAVRCCIDDMVFVHGGLHIVINNAGMPGRQLETADYPLEEWHRVMAVNLHGVFHVMKYAIKPMLAQGQGHLVNIAAELPTNGWAGSAAYVAARHALLGMTRSAAAEYADRGLRINAIGPSFIDAPLPAALQPGEYAEIVGLKPTGVSDTPEQIAALACSLLTPDAAQTNGSYQLYEARQPV